MANPPPAMLSGFATRAMPQIRNPIYNYDYDSRWKQTPQPAHVLERPPPAPAGVDARLTAQGDTSRATGLTPLVGMAYQTPYNVWALYPA
jgi:hypothetical protein